MAWQEEQHPRDDEGKFTFKNGSSSSSSPTEILYGKLAKSEKEKSDTKNKLLDALGKNATPVDILYGDEESLTKKIEANKMKNSDFMTPINSHKTDFQKDTQKHELLRQFSIYCYDNGRQELPKGYDRVGRFENKSNGFASVVAKNDKAKEIVIAYRGMEPPSRDVGEVAKIRFFEDTKQQKDAQAVYEKIKNNPQFKDYKIYTTGTSLGGYLAQYVAAKNNLKSATFNTYHGSKKALEKEGKGNSRVYPDNIVNYRNEKDSLSQGSMNNNLGISLTTKEKIRRNEKPIYHFVENIGDLNKAKLQNRDFSEKL